MREGPARRSPEQLTKNPPGTFVGRRSGLRSLAALGLLAPALILGGVSCAVGGVENPLAEGQTAAPERGSRYLITAAEMRSASAGTLYDAVQRLRPLWLRLGPPRSRGIRSEIMVIQNGQYFGPAQILRQMTPLGVFSITYMDGISASAEFSYPGAQPHIVGAIVVDYIGPR